MTMTKFARDNMLRYVMKTAHSITKDVGVGMDKGLKAAWSMLRFSAPVKFTKVVGVTYGNSQQVLRALVNSKTIFYVNLKRENFNIHDNNAIAVYVVVGISKEFKVGYINSTRASSLAYEMDTGKTVIVLKAEITGDEVGKQYLGLNLKFIVI
jgi:hypothetical protein